MIINSYNIYVMYMYVCMYVYMYVGLLALSYSGMIMSCVWVYLISNEIVGLFTSLGTC